MPAAELIRFAKIRTMIAKRPRPSRPLPRFFDCESFAAGLSDDDSSPAPLLLLLLALRGLREEMLDMVVQKAARRSTAYAMRRVSSA